MRNIFYMVRGDTFSIGINFTYIVYYIVILIEALFTLYMKVPSHKTKQKYTLISKFIKCYRPVLRFIQYTSKPLSHINHIL